MKELVSWLAWQLINTQRKQISLSQLISLTHRQLPPPFPPETIYSHPAGSGRSICCNVRQRCPLTPLSTPFPGRHVVPHQIRRNGCKEDKAAVPTVSGTSLHSNGPVWEWKLHAGRRTSKYLLSHSQYQAPHRPWVRPESGHHRRPPTNMLQEVDGLSS